jgi:hypothetical protein
MPNLASNLSDAQGQRNNQQERPNHDQRQLYVTPPCVCRQTLELRDGGVIAANGFADVC